MANIRIIPRLDIKGPNLIKGIHLEGLRVVGDPQEFAHRYYAEGADELIYMDIVASLYGRNSLKDIVRRTAKDVFIPLTVGGGIRSTDDVRDMLRAGADKVAINTAAVKRPELISEISRRFGSQCCVVSVEAKRRPEGGWEAYVDNGRERTGLDVIAWVRQAEQLGAGELLVTSVDQEGTKRGFDIELFKAVTSAVRLPVIGSGGMGSQEHFNAAVRDGGVDAVAIADVFHYKRMSIGEVRQDALAAGLQVRKL
ncbi:MAG: imidazole glycerol phosphate synthase subunit HisF [Rhodocyclaceae bacterium]|nr:MAG: imidazole glycerol phosphate synthase subunit HisF [Rhodocyclaceae bacterium]